MAALRLLLAVLVLLGAGAVTLGVIGAGLEPTVATVEVELPDDMFAN